MSQKNPLHNDKAVPSKEELQEYLGPARYRRFEAVYDELVDLDFTAKLIWSDVDQSWCHAFHFKKKPIFCIRWGIDYFYASIDFKPADFSQLQKHDQVKPDAKQILQKGSAIQSRGIIQVEANLEHSKEQEAFFDLLPLLMKQVT